MPAEPAQLIDVLLLHRTIDSDDVIAGIEAALTVGAVTADVVAVEARRHASLEVDAGGSDSGRHLVARRSGREQRVVSLTQRRLAIRQRSSLVCRPILGLRRRSITTTNSCDYLNAAIPPSPLPEPSERRPENGSSIRHGFHHVAPPRFDRGGRHRRGRSSVPPTTTSHHPCRRRGRRHCRPQGPAFVLRISAELLLSECDDRDRRSVVRRIKGAGFPREKWLADFDFDANPNINPATIGTLATGDWIRKGQPLCLIGDSGTGKSHLLIGLGAAAAEHGYRVKYVLATRLVNELVEAADEKQLARTIARYGRVDLLLLTSSVTWNSTSEALSCSSRF